MVDVLHQLLKKMVMHLLHWVKLLLKMEMQAARKQTGGGVSYSELSGLNKLDAHFRRVPDFTGLKQFTRFSAVKQWTGVEQKAIVRQIMPVLAPLLAPKHPHMLDFYWAFVNFILIAQYCSHDATTLGYLDQALERINVYKEALRSYWATLTNVEGRFNFPKFHTM